MSCFCPECDRDFTNEDDLNYHYGMIHDPRIFQGDYEIGLMMGSCGKRCVHNFSNKLTLETK